MNKIEINRAFEATEKPAYVCLGCFGVAVIGLTIFSHAINHFPQIVEFIKQVIAK